MSLPFKVQTRRLADETLKVIHEKLRKKFRVYMSLPGSFKDLRKQDMVKWSESQMSGTTHANALFGSDGRWALRLH